MPLVLIARAREDDLWLTDPGPRWRLGLCDGAAQVWVACTQGHRANLAAHTIDADGTVHPSLVCPVEGCGWHVWGQLQDWVP